MKFKLESTQEIILPTSTSTLKTYSLPSSNLTLLLCTVPGPLISTSIIIPTTNTNNKGLAHTLEHLVFCGTTEFKRGYLDTMAVRCLSTGTNAYTSTDHTAYEISTVGDGMIDITPVFLSHILQPLLTKSQFMTEVYHVDGNGKSQGVVFCEMASRENTEADLLDLELRRMCYGEKGTYAFECGGLTGDIELLDTTINGSLMVDNDEVVEYHKKFYHSDNVTILVCGSGNFDALISKLEEYPHLLQGNNDSTNIPTELSPPLYEKEQELSTRTVKFPSDDSSVGSIGYIWPGPGSDDFKTITALEVLHRYFTDNPSSLFRQGFVERVEPWASDVDMEVGDGVDANMVWIFSGVPRDAGSGSSSGSDSEGNSESEDESMDSHKDDETKSNTSSIPDDLFSPGIYYQKVMSLLQKVSSPEYDLDMSQTLKRHGIKLLESLEDSPHETIAMAIVPDIIRYHLNSKNGQKLKVGSRLKVFDVLKELEKEKPEYWKSMVIEYFINRRVSEVMMVPDKQLSDDLAKKQRDDEARRIKELGKAGLAKVARRVAKALEENKIDLDEDTMASMPPVPSAAKAATIPSRVDVINLCEDGSIFGTSQVIRTETAFVHLGMAISIARVPKDLRPYLVLFQELLFQSPLELITETGVKVEMPYEEVSTHASKLFISHECGVGFGNSYFSASYLTQVLTIFVTGMPAEWELVVRFVTQVLLFSKFIKKRIITVAKNLLSSIVDVKRDGNGVLGATLNRICLSNEFAEKCGSNENAISIFQQEGFLERVIEKCKDGKENEIIKDLNALRDFVVSSNTAEPTFIRIGVPMRFSLLQSSLASPSLDITNDFLRIWDSEYSKFPQPKMNGKKRKSATVQKTFAFPFPRIPFEMDQMDIKFSKSIVVPVSGLSTSYVSQFVPCDLLKTPKHPDYFPTVLLAEILSITDGPLYDGVRGKGYAYGVSLSCYLWAGQLSFELYRSSEPKKGLAVFHSILKELFTPEGFKKYCGKYEIETAKASVAYRWAANCATSSAVISTALRSSMQGFKDLNDYRGFISNLDLVTTKDLERVLKQYYSLFFEDKVTVVVTPANDGEKIAKSMGKEFTTYALEDFSLN